MIVKAHVAGAQQRANEQTNHSGWHPIATAPRDGTVVEIKCVYGVAPWYGLFHYRDGRWRDVRSPRTGFNEGPTFYWRPHTGAVAAYADPTNGLQNDMAYWRGAVAAKYGLPLDYFEPKP